MKVILFLERFFSKFIDFTRINPILWFMNHVFEIVEIRKKGNIVKKDYLQILIDCQTLTTIVNIFLFFFLNLILKFLIF